jgi:iron complex transport system substrate-binding protein
MRAGALMAFAALVPAAAAEIVVTDDLGQRVALARPAARIVSIAPGSTEMLFAAGAGARVIATVEYSIDPPEAKRLPRIGDAHAIDMERLVALRPDVVVAWPGGNNAAQVERIERLGIPLYLQRVDRLDDMPASLRRLGALAGTQRGADAAADALAARLAALEARYASKPTLSVLLQVWDRPIYTVGGTHLMSDALRTCGAVNTFRDLPELGPAVDLEAVLARDPAMIVAVGPREATGEWLAGWKRFATMQAVRGGRLAAFHDPRLSRLGPGIVDATEALCRLIDRARPAG